MRQRPIRTNLKNYQPELGTIIAEHRIGFGRRRSSLQRITLCVDQSGTMASPGAYSGALGAVLASLPAMDMRTLAFETSVVDLTDELHDSVELLFGVHLEGGTDINRSLACYARKLAPSAG